MLALLAALSLGAVMTQDTLPEPVVIELRIGRITGATVPAYRVRSEVLLPLSQFFRLVEIRRRLTPDGRLDATVDPGNLRIVVDPRSDSMQYGDRSVRIEREFIHFDAPELYVGSERLGDLLGVTFAVDWSDLTATVIDPSSLPIVRRLRREAARDGISITNAPFVRPSLIGALRYGGTLEPGWSVEAYRGGDLVAYDSADASGAFAIDLPVRYGENPVDFVAYGPFGEIREFNRTYRVLNELLPARRFEYGLSGGRCPQPSFICSATTNLDLRYGATARWTVQGGLDRYWRDSLPDRTHPYAALVGNPSNAWAIQTEVVGAGLVRGALRYEPSVDLRLEGEYVHFTRDSASALAVPGRRAQWTLNGFFRPKTSHGFFFFDGRFERISTDAGALTRTRLGASLQTDEMRLLPNVRTEHGPTGAAEYLGLATLVMPQARWGRFLSQTLLRTNAEIERQTGL